MAEATAYADSQSETLTVLRPGSAVADVCSSPEAWRNAFNWSSRYLEESTVQDRQVEELVAQVEALVPVLDSVDPALALSAQQVLKLLREPRVTVAFCGRWKAGKSLLLSRLVGQDILPVNVNAETGAPCFISCGQADEATVVRTGRRTTIPCEVEAIRDEISLWKNHEVPGAVEETEAVEIQLRDCAVPTGVCWVDTPGFDESEGMSMSTQAVLQSCDLLVCVTTSEIDILSMTHFDFIASHVEQAGPLGVVFLTNVIIRDSARYDEAWEEFVTRQMPWLRERFLANQASLCLSEEHPPRMLSVCAAAISEADSRYGAGEVRTWLHSIRSPRHAMIRAARLNRATLLLESIGQNLATREQAARAAHAQQEDRQRAEEAVARENRVRFDSTCQGLIDRLYADFAEEARLAAQALAAEITPKKLKDRPPLQRDLDLLLWNALHQAWTRFQSSVSEAAFRGGIVMAPRPSRVKQAPVSVRIEPTPAAAAANPATEYAKSIMTWGNDMLIANGLTNTRLGEDRIRAAEAEALRQATLTETRRVVDETRTHREIAQRYIEEQYPAPAAQASNGDDRSTLLGNLRQSIQASAAWALAAAKEGS